jgi:beta-mannosidase
MGNDPEVDLSGEWMFGHSPDPKWFSMPGLKPCSVPGAFELDLHAAGEMPDPYYGLNILKARDFEREYVWYVKRFPAAEKPGMAGELVFEGLDCFAEVWLNGTMIGYSDNMLVEQVFPTKGLLRGDNELKVRIRPAVEAARPFEYPPSLGAFRWNWESLFVRKAPHMYGWDIMPRAVSAGIWRPVRLRYLRPERLERVFLRTVSLAPGFSRAELVLDWRAALKGEPGVGYSLAVEGKCGNSRFAARGPADYSSGRMRFSVDDPLAWWPAGYGEPALYEVRASLLRNGREADALSFTHGIRTVSLDRTPVTAPDGEGRFHFLVNGTQVFARGTNWVPLDAFHGRDAERTTKAVEMAVDLNCNMIRCWGGNVYESDPFFDLCDRHGLMVWQDFAMACALYPQDAEFKSRLADEARRVVRRLRQHPSLVLWCGDNECDAARMDGWFGARRDPAENSLTREVLPGVLDEEDGTRPYIASSPLVEPEALKAGERSLPENHLWGPRGWYKSDFYTGALCHFVSEIGYHGCPDPESVARFISPGRLWPHRDNPEWNLHSTEPWTDPEARVTAYRVDLMEKQVRMMFGAVPGELAGFSRASQAVQAEAMKFFIERFRSAKWRRSGIIWWNLVDGWPQFSDSLVDWYWRRKAAYEVVKRSQAPVCLMLSEPEGGEQELVAANDTLKDVRLSWRIRPAGPGDLLAEGSGTAPANRSTVLARIPAGGGGQEMLLMEWNGDAGGRNHYLRGEPPFGLATYLGWLKAAGLG